MDIVKEMVGKVIKGNLNGKKVAEQWINVNTAISVAIRYAEIKVNEEKKRILEGIKKL